MKALLYYIFYAIMWIFTLLPMWVLYLPSDILFLFLYYITRYRRKTVLNNLRNAFPEKNKKEINSIARKFYRHLADMFAESIKLIHLSDKQLMKRMKLTNPEIFEKLYNENRDIVAILGHYNNWEWLACLPHYTKHKTISIYKPLSNRYFDDFMISLRSDSGMTLTPMSQVVREIVNSRNNNIRSCYSFLSDQTPPKPKINYWTNFLNQDTPVYTGAEKIAIKYDMAVVFFNIRKIKRGYYSLTVELLFEHTAGLSEHAITDKHVKRLEEIINENPQYWIWSHRRWKHNRENVNA